jgi:hypothetical protein
MKVNITVCGLQELVYDELKVSRNSFGYHKKLKK